MRKARARPGAHGPHSLYRLAVPMSDETLASLERFCEQWDCTRTEAARWLLAAAAQLYQRGNIDFSE